MTNRDKLANLAAVAYEALERKKTKGISADRNALLYMIHQAEAVLSGEDICPNSGSRAFYQMDNEKMCQFVYSHYVMFGFEKEKQGEEHYGLKQALDWFFSIEEGDSDHTYDASFYFEENETDYLLFSEAEWKQIKKQIGLDSETKRQYVKIKAIADRNSLEKVRSIWQATWEQGAKLPESEILYSDTAKGINFQAPCTAAYAKLSFSLSNEAALLQTYHISNIRIMNSYGEVFSVEPLIELDRVNMIYTSDTTFPVEDGMVYTLHFQVDQRQKVRKGIQVEVAYMDGEGHELKPFCYEYNRKAWYPVNTFNLDMQCNAICYEMSGDLQYAEKAMCQMLLFLDDFCQGVMYWMMYNSRPEGRDNYGAVQAGRNLCGIAFTYALIKDALVWEEKNCIYKNIFFKMAEFVLNDVLDLRDRTRLTSWRVQRGTGNWQTDMSVGAAMIAAAVEEIPYRKQWIYNAEVILSAQLSCNLNEDGSWPESLRYHHAVLEHFCSFARFWEHETGENWFYENHLERMFAYSIGVQMPPYRYFQNRISTPPFGDHKLGNGSEYQILGYWIERITETDRVLAAQIRETWALAGYPVKELHGEAVVAEQLLLMDGSRQYSIEFPKEYRTVSRSFPDAGIYLLRRSHEDQTISCMAVMCSGGRIGHGHLDQGSFQYYYHNVPIIMDSGIEGYFDSTTQWHISSYSHACMLFAAKQKPLGDAGEINLSAGEFTRRLGWCDTPIKAQLLSYDTALGKERFSIKVDNPEGEGYHIRTISLRDDGEIIVCDEVHDFEGEILFCLPLLMKEVLLREEGRKVCAMGTGYYDVDVKITSLRPVKKAWVEYGRVTPMYPEEGDVYRIPYLRMISNAGTGFEVMIQANYHR